MSLVVTAVVVVVAVAVAAALLVGVVVIAWSQGMDRASADRAPTVASSVELPCSAGQVEMVVDRRARGRTAVEV